MGDMWDDMEDDDNNSEASETAEVTSTTESSETTSTSETTKTEVEPEEDPYETPGFEFSRDMQRPVYVRDDAWKGFNNGLFADVEYHATKRGLENVRTYEIHQALMTVINESVDWSDVLDAVAEERGIDDLEE